MTDKIDRRRKEMRTASAFSSPLVNRLDDALGAALAFIREFPNTDVRRHQAETDILAALEGKDENRFTPYRGAEKAEHDHRGGEPK